MATATTYRPQDPSGRWRGLLVVLLLHLLLGWLLLDATLDKRLELAKKPPEVIVIQEVRVERAPAPPMPPVRDTKPQATKAAPSQAGPTPGGATRAAVAPVEIVAPPVAVAPISSTPVAPTAALPVAPPAVAAAVVTAVAPGPASPGAPAPAPIAAATGTSGSADIGVACPTQVPPETPLRASRSGTTGVVVAQAVIRNGAVADVTILSGPAVFHAAVRNAMRQYKCSVSADEAVVTQRFVFKLE
ncbi:MAG: energy transducer TonB [Rhodoferax sp.]|nr:energy transducer TonB [Rhodoferax sp.]